jgi:hypothetical protein
MWRLNESVLEARNPEYSKSCGFAMTAADSFELVELWFDVSTWHANNLRMETTSQRAPTHGAAVTQLVEDSQNTWRNIQVAVKIARERPIRVSAEIRLESVGRQPVLMVLSGGERFAGTVNRATRITSSFRLGRAVVSSCNATPLPDNWWRIELVGILSRHVGSDPVFVCIAITRDAFREDYLGNGKSGIAVGAVSLAQELHDPA